MIFNDIRMPGDFSVALRLFGRFTSRDLLRLAVPPLLMVVGFHLRSLSLYSWQGIAALTVAAGLSGLLYLWRPYGRALDRHLFEGIRWVIELRYLEDESVEIRNRYAVLDDGTVVGVLKVNAVNVAMMSDGERGALHGIQRELFDVISYPVYIYSRQTPLSFDSYLQSIQQRDSGLGQLRSSYLSYCMELGAGNLSKTTHYVGIRVEPDSLRWLHQMVSHVVPWLEEVEPDEEALATELDRRCRDVSEALDTAGVSVERLSGRELNTVVKNENGRNLDPSPLWTARDAVNGYRRTLCLTEFPRSVSFAWPRQLLQTDGLVDVTQVIEPKGRPETSKRLSRLEEKLKTEIESLLGNGMGGTRKFERLLEDVEWFQDLLADDHEQPVSYAAYVTAHGGSGEQCLRTFEQLQTRLQTMHIEYEQPVLRTDRAAATESLLHGDPLNEQLLMPSRSAASGFPFATQSVDQDNGVIYGVDASDETPLLLDRFSWSSQSLVRMGMVGSGKSYATKIELLRAAVSYPDLQIIVVDPKNEYGQIVRRLDGRVQTLDSETTYDFDERVVGFQIPERGQREFTEVLVDIVEQIHAAVSKDDSRTLVVIDEARNLLNDEVGQDVLNRFVLEGRDTNTAITLVTQNASHFTHSRAGREILDNVPGKVFFRHDRVPEDVVEYFDFSQRETQSLYKLKDGTDSEYSEALLKVSGRLDTKVRIDSTETEHAVIEGGDET